MGREIAHATKPFWQKFVGNRHYCGNDNPELCMTSSTVYVTTHEISVCSSAYVSGTIYSVHPTMHMISRVFVEYSNTSVQVNYSVDL